MVDSKNIHTRVDDVRARIRDHLHGQKLTQPAALAMMLEMVEVIEWLLEGQDQVDHVMTQFFQKPVMAVSEGSFHKLAEALKTQEEEEELPKPKHGVSSPYMQPGQYL